MNVLQHPHLSHEESDQLEKLLATAPLSRKETLRLLLEFPELSRAKILLLRQRLEGLAMPAGPRADRTMDIRLLGRLADDHRQHGDALDGSLRPTPAGLVRELDRVMYGQEAAKKALCTELYYHAAGLKAGGTVALIGPSGSGKNHLVRHACQLLDVGLTHVDCSTLVPEGIRGKTLQESLPFLRHKPEGKAGPVVLLDEFDKIFTSHFDESLGGQLLQVLEDGHAGKGAEGAPFLVLAGAFQRLHEAPARSKGSIGFHAGAPAKPAELDLPSDLRNAGMPSEILGRIERLVVLQPLCEAGLREILSLPGSPLEKVNAMLAPHVRLEFGEAAVREIAAQAFRMGTGARGLQSVVRAVAEPYLFSAPSGGIRGVVRIESVNL